MGQIMGNEQIVTNGLVLSLDAADRNSYPGSGTSWFDVSTSQSIGTITNSPTFSTNNGGFFSFVSDDFVQIPESQPLNNDTPSVEVWVKTNNLNQNGFWFEKGQVNSQYSLFQEGTTIRWRHNFVTGQGLTNLSIDTATYLNTSQWFQVFGTFTSGNRRLYVNGVLANSDTQSGTLNANTNGMSIGVYGGFNGSRGYYYDGSISIVRVYNRALSVTEVLQNYNSERSRFGL